MRIMFAIWPMAAHLYPGVPLAQALQSAGHEVCVASHPLLTPTVTAAGLTAVEIGTPDTMAPLSAAEDFMPDEEESNQLLAALVSDPADRPAAEMFTLLLGAVRMYNTVRTDSPSPGVDDVVAFARNWRPDLIVWEQWPAAAVAARLCGAAHARLLCGPDYWAWGRERSLASGAADPTAQIVAPIARRYGLEVDEELVLGQWTIDPTPAALRLPTTEPRVVSMRRVPAAGGAVLPRWLTETPQRPRVAVTLGTSGRALNYTDGHLLADVLEAVGGLDAEVVATFDALQLEGQKVPANTRTLDFVPLSALLGTCEAVVHHGGGGTFAAAVAQKVPQLIETSGELECAAYADYVTGRSGGLALNHSRQSPREIRESIQRVLEEPLFRKGTDTLHAEWLAMPAPTELVPTMEKLTAQYRS
ncbi:glycosyltransferase [Streptomyces candidus]|uniref:UDP:flavonoid glycosyltransferase YjiC (YdhE family) n=1 Tax=Streptomyces candidus TaxID=67283 RepID=A0A7X0HFI6_9ACTN|nr:glycosyltransferase [Streptomyces candidus]MBB6436689.1 UDP:flavonoid glycosyltransferase YjiC (YdhE family) [Streptomyces candidus]GHH51076.1 glycosyl transferase [Streptomyces candidus]